MKPWLDLPDPVDVHDRGTADPNELVRVEMPRDPRERLALLVDLPPGMNPYQLPGRLDPVHRVRPKRKRAVHMTD